VLLVCSLPGLSQDRGDPLSPEERAWLQAHGPLRYAPHVEAPPFEFFRADGQVAGIVPELLAVLARNLSAEIKPVRFATWPEALEAVRRGEADFLGLIRPTPERGQFLQFTPPCLDVQNVLFVNEATAQVRGSADLAGRRVGVVRDYAEHAWLKEHHPEATIVPVATTREGLLLLGLGQVDAVLETLQVGQYLIAENSLTGLRALPEVLSTTPNHMAVARDNARLLSVLTKGLNSVTEVERRTILDKWTGQRATPPARGVPAWVWQGGLALVVCLTLFAAWNYSLRRRVAEQTKQIRRSLSLLNATLESTADGILVVDTQGRVTSFNQRFLQLWGIPEPLAATKDDAKLLDHVLVQLREPEAFLAKVHALYATPEATSYDMLEFQDGRVFERYSQPQRLGTATVGRVWSFRDVTENKRAEEALQRRVELQDQLAKIAATVPGVICSFRLRPDGSVCMPYASPALEEILGLQPADVAEDFSPAFARLHPDDVGRAHSSIAESARTLLPWWDEFRVRHPRKGELWIEGRSVPRREPDGSILWHGFVQDITGRKQAEETRARLEAQLRQAQKMEAVGQLAGGVAHDFNNLLTVIVGNAGLLADEPALTPNLQEPVRQIATAAQRAADLTRQLLTFSRRQAMQIHSLNLNEVLSNISKMLHRLLGEHITLQCNFTPNLPPIEADAGMLEQVVVNLAVNARDAMPKGGRLVLSTQTEVLGPEVARSNPQARAGRFVVLRVADAGCGMDPTTLARLFEPFFTTKDVGKGTGLGLATVYGIVKQHNGWLEVTSQVGRGTTFKVFLPAAESSAPATEPIPKFNQDPVRGTETILLVEDDPSVLLLARTCLSRCGYHVLEAPNGVDALRVWREHDGQVDLLLTDMVMPAGMSGRDLAEQLRLARPDLRVLYSSGYSQELQDVGRLSIDALLPKPYDPRALLQAVRRRLDAQ